ELREDWQVGGRTWPGGTLLAARLDQFLAGDRDFEVLFAPTDSTALVGATWTRHHLVLNILDDVTGRLEVLTPPAGDGPWRRRPLDLSAAGTGWEAPRLATINVAAIDADESDELWLVVTGFLTPTTRARLQLDAAGGVVELEPLKSMPAFFDTTG